MQSLHRWATRFLILGAVCMAWLLPQGQAHAEICYDQDKNVVPCPKSNYALTQEALKAAGPSQTPVPSTDTPAPTETSTPVPPTPTPTNTATPAPLSAAAAIVPPPPPTDSSAPKPPPLMLLGILALGGLGLGTILLTQSRRRRRGAAQGPDQARDLLPGRPPGWVDVGDRQHEFRGTVRAESTPGGGMVIIEESPIDGAFDGSLGSVDVGGKGHEFDGGAWSEQLPGGGSVIHEEHPISIPATEEGPLGSVDVGGKEAFPEFTGWVDVGGKSGQFDGPVTVIATPGGGHAIFTEIDPEASDAGGVHITAVDIPVGKPEGKVAASANPWEDFIKAVNRLATAAREGLITGTPLGPGGGTRGTTNSGFGHETGHSVPGSGGGSTSGHGRVVSSTPSTGSTGGKKETGSDSGGKKETGNDGGGKKETGTDGGDDGGTDGGGKKETDEGTGGEKPKPGKGDGATPGEGDGDGNTGGRGLFRPGQGFAGGTTPDPDLDHMGRPARIGDLGGGPGQTGGRSTGEPDLDSNSGGDINAAYPGAGGRLAPSEGVGTDVGDPAD